MSTDLATIPMTVYPVVLPIPPPLLGPEDVLRAFLEGRKASTLRSYSYDLSDFAGFVDRPIPARECPLLLSLCPRACQRLVFRYRAELTRVV